MQFSTLLVAATTIAMTMASPVDLVPRTGACTGDQSVHKCCTSILTPLDPLTSVVMGLIGVSVPVDANLGIGCTLNIATCQNQQACCSGGQTNVKQNGLINIGPVVDLDCTIIQV